VKLAGGEFDLLKGFIEKHCGIHLEAGKESLIEARLSGMAGETGCRSFYDFYQKAQADVTGKLRTRIVEAMTTNETFFFRDDNLWTYMKEVAVPELLRKAAGSMVRVWSAASSTGQEAYSVAMLFDELARAQGTPTLTRNLEIIGTDISSAALFLAIAGRYSTVAVQRGLTEERRSRYFTASGSVWALSDEIKSRAKFRRFNIMDSLAPLGTFDLVLCRYVAIYFEDNFKKFLFHRIAGVLKPGCPLLLGATETLRGLSDEFATTVHKNCTVYQRKPSR
jgi:chemotaxis protein methyltransferase CheR